MNVRIQKRLKRNYSLNNFSLAQNFAKKMKHGNMNTLSVNSAGGILNLDDTISTGDGSTKHSVREILVDKRPASTTPEPDILLHEDRQSEPSNFIIFDTLNTDLILKAALKTKGAAGLSGLDAFA